MPTARPTTSKTQRRKAQRAVATARGTRRNRVSLVIGIVVVAVLAVAVIGGVLYQKHRNAEAARQIIPVAHTGITVPATLDRANATVLVGRSNAKVTVDAYEDFLCPICGQFEQANFPALEKQLTAGTINVRYHLLNLLDGRSNPPGYSTDAANTALAVATVAPQDFLDFHYSLYQKQPAEDGPGWTQDQLTSLANRLGVSGNDFDKLITRKTYAQQIQQNLTTAENDHNLWQPTSQGGSGFGTPTIAVNGKAVAWSQPGWLDQLVAGA